MTPVWMVASGKGGVGKTTIATSLAAGLAARDLDVVLVDLDMSQRNVDLLLGMENKVVFDIVDVMDGICPLEQALLHDKKRPHLYLLFASQIHDARALTFAAFDLIIEQLRARFAYVVIDCPSGVGHLVRLCAQKATDAIIVTTSDDIAIRDADRVVGLIKQEDTITVHLLVNRVRSEWVAQGSMYPPKVVAQTLDVPLLGFLEEDELVLRCQIQRQPIIESDGYAWQAVDGALRKLLGESLSPLSSGAYPGAAASGAASISLWTRLKRLFKR